MLPGRIAPLASKKFPEKVYIFFTKIYMLIICGIPLSCYPPSTSSLKLDIFNSPAWTIPKARFPLRRFLLFLDLWFGYNLIITNSCHPEITN
jgi:hypothetical protein